MANNNFVNVSMIAMEALRQLEFELVALSLAYRDKTSDFGQVGGYAVGDTVSIKTRPSYATDEFSGTINTQDIRQSKADFQIEKFYDISVPWTSREAALSIDSLSEDVITPAMQSMAQELDTYLLTKAWDGRGEYASTTLLQSAADIALARKEANAQQMSKSNRIGLVNGTLEATMLGTDAFNRFDSRESGGVSALENARIGRLMAIDWMSTENFTDESHTSGGGVGVTKTAPTAGTQNEIGLSVLTLNAAATGTFNDGDRIYVAGMKRPLIVNGTQATPSAINLAHQIDELVPVTAAVTVVSDGQTFNKAGIIFTPDAFAYAMPPLDLPRDKVAYVATANGMSIRVVIGYDQTTKTNTISFDCIVGAKCYDPRKVVVLGDDLT